MPTLKATGTKTTAVTEDTLATVTDNGVYVLVIDLDAMQDGDEIKIKTYTTVLNAGTSRIFQEAPFRDKQSAPIQMSLACPSDIEYHATIQRVAGTDRAYTWKILGL